MIHNYYFSIANVIQVFALAYMCKYLQLENFETMRWNITEHGSKIAKNTASIILMLPSSKVYYLQVNIY